MGGDWKAREGTIEPGEGTKDQVGWTIGAWKGTRGPDEYTRGLEKGSR